MSPDMDMPPYGLAPPAFRLPATTELGPVHLQISDLPRSLEYYERIVGFLARRVSEHEAVLTAPGDDRPLVTLRTRPGVTRARRGAFGLYHFAILLPDRAALGRFAAHLAAQDVHAATADHAVSEALYLWDPDGLGIEVYADRPRAAWPSRDRELVMTTEPLDIAGVVAAGGGRPWEGLPEGTTLGHVHLHVGDLREAEAFYHRALGFDKTMWSYPGALFLSAGGYHHHLGTNIWAPGPAPAADQARLLAWDLIVPSAEVVASAADSLRQAGYTVETPSGALLAADPWGTAVRVRARGEMRIEPSGLDWSGRVPGTE